MERQIPDPFGQLPGGAQVAGGGGALGRHLQGIGVLEPGQRRHRQRAQDLGAPQGAGQRGAELAARQLDRGELVERHGLRERVTGPAGHRDGPLGELGGDRVDVVAGVGLRDQQPGLRGHVPAGQSLPAGDQLAHQAVGRSGGHQPHRAADQLGRLGQVRSRGGRLTGPDGRVCCLEEQPERVVAEMPGLGRARGAAQRGGRMAAVRREPRGLLVPPL